MSSSYDVVVIGSGLSGLECAYILAQAGFNVCILEKNRQYGGNLQIFSRDKVIFDTGVHYLGGLDPGQNLHQFFTYFGLMDKLHLRRMDSDGFDRISFDTDPKDYKHAMGYEAFEASLIEDFPKEKEGIVKYSQGIQKVCRSFNLYYLKEINGSLFDQAYLEVGAKNFIESCTSNVKLQNVLAGSNALYAGDADKTPLYAHALVVNTYIESAYKCVDGGGQITKHFRQSLLAMGCTMMNYAEVIKLNVSGGNISSALLNDGRIIYGKQFISNIHPAQTLKLINPEKIKKTYRNRITSLQNSVSVFTVHLVFKENTFPYLNYNYYHHKTDDAWAAMDYKEENWPECYALFVPAESRSSQYASGMNVMAYMRYSEVEKWQDSFNTVPKHKNERSAEYQDWKTLKAEKLIDELVKKWPDLRSQIKSYYTSTPLSYRDYIGSGDGSLYGIQKDYNNPLKSYVSPRTKIPNLFLTGQNLNMHGILGVTVSSVVTCGQFLDINNLIRKINSAN